MSGKISREEYHAIIDEAVAYIRGGGTASIEELERQMFEASDALDFERAARLRDQIAAVKKISDKQTVLLGEDRQMDVWGFAENGGLVSCVILKIREGKIADKENFTFDKQGSADGGGGVYLPLLYRTSGHPESRCADKAAADMEMFAGFLKLQCEHNVQAVVPQRGERKRLMEMAQNNALEQLAH